MHLLTETISILSFLKLLFPEKVNLDSACDISMSHSAKPPPQLVTQIKHIQYVWISIHYNHPRGQAKPNDSIYHRGDPIQGDSVHMNVSVR